LPISVETLGARLFVAARTTASTCAGERAIEMQFGSSSVMSRRFAYSDDCLQALFLAMCPVTNPPGPETALGSQI
jgi:hypothetical protein